MKFRIKAGEGNETVSLSTNVAGEITEINLGEGLQNNLKKAEKVPFLLASFHLSSPSSYLSLLSFFLNTKTKKKKFFFLNFQLILEASKEASRSAALLLKPLSKSYQPKMIQDILETTCSSSLHQRKLFYENDEIIVSEGLNPPPVSNLLCVYGVNLDTEVCQFYKRFAFFWRFTWNRNLEYKNLKL